MPVLTADAAYLSSDMLKKGIIETIVKESPLMSKLPFITVSGNAYKYNLETGLASAKWYLPNETWVEGVSTWEQRTTALTILGGDADVDSFLQQTRSNEQDLKAAIIELKGKAIAHEFEKQAIVGDLTVAGAANSMEGILRLIGECESKTTPDLDALNNSQVILAGTQNTPAAVSLAKMDELFDAVRPKPDCYLMNRNVRRQLNALLRVTTGTSLAQARDEYGRFIESWNGVPIYINDWIKDNVQDSVTSVLAINSYDYDKTRASGYDNSFIIAIRFGEEDGVCGLQNGTVKTEDLGTLETKDASRTRIKWYCGLTRFSTLSVAILVDVIGGSGTAL